MCPCERKFRLAVHFKGVQAGFKAIGMVAYTTVGGNAIGSGELPFVVVFVATGTGVVG